MKLKLKIFLEKMRNDKYKTIIIEDYRNYESGKSCDGGCYLYIEKYKQINKQTYEISYNCSASTSFSFCRILGHFQDCSSCLYFIENECTIDFDKISINQVIDKINEIICKYNCWYKEENNNFIISYDYLE